MKSRESNLTEYARNKLKEARETPKEKYIFHEEVKKQILKKEAYKK